MPADSIPYGILCQKHPDYDIRVWAELLDLYAGGYQLARNAEKYMPQLAGEGEVVYRDRLKAAGYIGYLGQIIDYFVSSLFTQDISVSEAPDANDPTTPGGKSDTEFYSAFAHDADLAGNGFANVLRDAFRHTLLLKKALICADFPTAPETSTIITRADEDKLGTNRAYIYEMPIDQLINWELDKQGNYEFAVIYKQEIRQAAPNVKRGTAITHKFKVWTKDPDGRAHWATYEKVQNPETETLTDDTPIPLVDDAATSFVVIPIIQLEVKAGLWVGNKLGCLAKEHYCRRSTLVASENKSMMAVPVVSRGPEMSAIGEAVPSITQQSPYRGSNPIGRFQAMGWVEIGKDDSLSFVEPEGKCYAQVREELKELKDEMHRIVHQMAASVDNKASSTRRSGESKRADRVSESIVLGQFGKDLREGAKKIYDVIAGGRGEQVVWVPRGLDSFESEDRTDLILESSQLDTVAIPSPTFSKEYKTVTALKLVPNAPPEMQDQIRKEIADGVDADTQIKDLQRKATIDGLKNPQPPAPTANANGAPPKPGPVQAKTQPPQDAA